MKKHSQSQLRQEKKRLVCDVLDVYEGNAEAGLRWLLEPLPALQGQRPVDCLDDPEKLAQVWAVVRKLETGDFS